MPVVREVRADDWCVRLDLSRQVLRLEVPEVPIEWRRGKSGPAAMPLSPVPHFPEGAPVSAATLLLKAKQFDDRLYAGVELAAQGGAGRFAGKATLLRSLAETLAAALPDTSGGAATLIHAACDVGGVPVAVPEALSDSVGTAKAHFLDDELLSRPLGFYTWRPELSAIFRQDRFLQQPLDPATADNLNRALEQTPGALDGYNACLRLNASLTNPPKRPGLYDAGKRPPFFPPCRSHEVALFEGRFGDRPVPERFDLMGELIRRVRSGEMTLTPTERSGWYDYQTWSLEPLVVPDRMPERARLELGKRYRKHLEDLFRGALALARETHARQVGGGRGGYAGAVRRPIRITPGLTVEPLPSLYARRSECYRFIRSVLEEAFGPDALDKLHGVAPEGLSATSLAEELAWFEKLFAGAAATACRELGMQPPDDAPVTAPCFSAWQAAMRTDRDVGRDARMMMAVFHDVQRNRTKVWALLGWRTTAVGVDYRVPPNVLAVEPWAGAMAMAGEPPPVLCSGERHEFAVPVMAEVYVSRLLDRDEFRRHCDRYRTREAILANLA